MSGKFGSDEREIPDEKEVIRRQIDAMRDHVYSHIIWYEREFLIHLTFQMTFPTKTKFFISSIICLYSNEKV